MLITIYPCYNRRMDFLEQHDKDGKMISPKLPEGKKNYLVDIDGTICEDIPNEEPERMKTAQTLPGALAKVNSWYDDGNIITFFTSRTEAEHGDITRQWLKENGFKYHSIIFHKPRGGAYVWVDDREIDTIKVIGGFE